MVIALKCDGPYLDLRLAVHDKGDAHSVLYHGIPDLNHVHVCIEESFLLEIVLDDSD